MRAILDRVRAPVGAAWLLTASGLLVSAGSLGFNIIMARIGGAAAYGTAGALLSLSSLALFLATGSQYAVARRAAISGRAPRTQLAAALASTWPWIVLSLATLAGSGMIASYLHLGSRAPAILAVAVFAATVTLTPLTGLLIGRERFVVFALINVGAMFLRLVAGISLLWLGTGVVTASLVATLIAALALGSVVVIVALGGGRDRLPDSRATASLQSMRLSGDGLFGAVLSICIYGGWSLPLFLGRHSLTSGQAGSLASAQLLATGILFLTSPITAAYLPSVARRPSGGLVAGGLLQTLGVAIGVGTALSAAGTFLVPILYGKDFADATRLLPLLAISATALSGASYGLWMTRAMHRHSLPVVLGTATGLAFALVLGVVVEHSVVGLTLLPGAGAVVASATALLAVVAQRRLGRIPLGIGAPGRDGAMRVLILNWKDPAAPDAGGAEHYILRVAQQWQAEGHAVTMFVPRLRATARDEVQGGIRFLRRGNKVSVYWHARRFVRSYLDQFDVVLESACHRPFFTNEEGAPKATVLYYHLAADQWRHEFRFPLSWIGQHILEPLWARRLEAARVVVISPSTASDLGRVGVKPTGVVPPGCDVPPQFQQETSSSTPRLVFMGRLVSSKRPGDALHAFARIRGVFPDAVLDVIGDGYLSSRLRAEKHPGVTFHGYIHEARKSQILGRADIMLLPATHEGWGIVAMEAAAHGVPVVAYDVAGLRDAIVDDVTGILTKPRPSALGLAAISLLFDPERWLRLSIAARERAAEFTWKRTADQLMALVLREAEVPARAPVPTRRAWSAAVAFPAAPVGDGFTGQPPDAANSRLTIRRRTAAGVGVLAILFLGIAGADPASAIVAMIALLAIIYALVVGVRERRGTLRPWQAWRRPASREAWLAATGSVAAVALAAVQTWFVGGGAIALGDMTPPNGTAWLGRVFDGWTWSGSNLGAGSTNQLLLPWAAVLGAVHQVGGSPVMAQRLWYTLLFVGASLSAMWFLRTAGLGPLGAAAGALIYVFNAYVITTVNVNPVFLCALATLPLLPAILLTSGRGWLSPLHAGLLMALTAPLLGFAALNPPLVGMLVGVAILTPFAAAWLGGAGAARRSARALAIGLPALLLLSVYWIVPLLVQMGTVATGRLASYQDWAWTEARASLANGFWLNGSWAWSFPQFFPYAHLYDSLPLVFVKFLVPALAFGSLLIAGVARARPRRELPGDRHRRDQAMSSELSIAVLGAAVAIPLIVLSTGTNPPAAPLFLALYRLPLGWLLREPGRFLMLAGLAYGLMAGVTIESIADAAQRWLAGRTFTARLPVRALAGVMAGTLLAVGPGFPLALGAVVPDQNGPVPSGHVVLPPSWQNMASYLNQAPGAGSVLVLPPDDFYQMPYTWGYYGTDGFITDLFSRRAIVPNDHNYSPASAGLLQTVSLTTDAMLHRNWPAVVSMLQVLDARYVLVRGDIDINRFGDRHITPPQDISSALAGAPNIQMVHQEGELRLYEVAGISQPAGTSLTPVMTASAVPDLRVLPYLGQGDHLVLGQPVPGRALVVQVADVSTWKLVGDSLTTTVTEAPGWDWNLVRLDGGGGTALAPANRVAADTSKPADIGDGIKVVESRPDNAGNRQLLVSMPISSDLIDNGDFAKGQWQEPGDCHDVGGRTARSSFVSSVIASGGGAAPQALRLSTSADSICESRYLVPPAGKLLLVTAGVRHVGGLQPRLSLWEFGPEKFAQMPPASATDPGWHDYRAIVQPDARSSRLQLFVHSDADGTGVRSVNDYASVHVLALPASPSLALIGKPLSSLAGADRARLQMNHESYDARWTASPNGQHVIVDGLVNGWLTSGPVTAPVSFQSLPSDLSGLVSAASFAALMGLLVMSLALRLRR